MLLSVIFSSLIIARCIALPQYGNTNSGNAADNTGNSVDDSGDSYQSPPFWSWPSPDAQTSPRNENVATSTNGNAKNLGSGPSGVIYRPISQASSDSPVKSEDDTSPSSAHRCLSSREPQFGNGVNGMFNCGNGGDNSGNGYGGSSNGNENEGSIPPPANQTASNPSSGSSGNVSDTSNPPLEPVDDNNGATDTTAANSSSPTNTSNPPFEPVSNGTGARGSSDTSNPPFAPVDAENGSSGGSSNSNDTTKNPGPSEDTGSSDSSTITGSGNSTQESA